ncbi:MAG: hypothetical protein AAGB26_11670 [Planctomycetota bacterium]
MRGNPAQLIHSLLLTAYFLFWAAMILVALTSAATGIVVRTSKEGNRSKTLLLFLVPSAVSVGLLFAVLIPKGINLMGNQSGLLGFPEELISLELLLFSVFGIVAGLACSVLLAKSKSQFLKVSSLLLNGVCIFVSAVLIVKAFLGI